MGDVAVGWLLMKRLFSESWKVISYLDRSGCFYRISEFSELLLRNFWAQASNSTSAHRDQSYDAILRITPRRPVGHSENYRAFACRTPIFAGK